MVNNYISCIYNFFIIVFCLIIFITFVTFFLVYESNLDSSKRSVGKMLVISFASSAETLTITKSGQEIKV